MKPSGTCPVCGAQVTLYAAGASLMRHRLYIQHEHSVHVVGCPGSYCTPVAQPPMSVLQITPTDDRCIIWRGIRHFRGYAELSLRGKTIRASRLLLEGKLGRPLLCGMLACHSCDNPPCVNPDHLWEGTNSENQADSVRKGRHVSYFRTHPEAAPRGAAHYSRTRPHLTPRGQRCRSARFTPAQVLEIRERHAAGESARGLARELGVSHTAIHYIVKRRNWKHVAGAAS